MNLPNSKNKILCIDTNATERENLVQRLLLNGYLVEQITVQDFNIIDLKKKPPELILLGLNQFDDLEVLRKIKSDNITKETTVFVYSEINDDFFEVSTFRNGADDYIQKPLRIAPFISKIEAFFNRKKVNHTGQLLVVNGLEINSNNLSIKFPTGKVLHLPKKEFTLIQYLAEHAGQIYNRNELLNRVWGEDVFIGERTVDVHIRRLREKIGNGYIMTLKGVGYMFQK